MKTKEVTPKLFRVLPMDIAIIALSFPVTVGILIGGSVVCDCCSIGTTPLLRICISTIVSIRNTFERAFVARRPVVTVPA